MEGEGEIYIKLYQNASQLYNSSANRIIKINREEDASKNLPRCQLIKKSCKTQIHTLLLSLFWLIRRWPHSYNVPFAKAAPVGVNRTYLLAGAPLKSPCSACAPRRANFHVSMLILFTAREKRCSQTAAPKCAARIEARSSQNVNAAAPSSSHFANVERCQTGF